MAFQIRVAATCRLVNRSTGSTPGRPFQISTRRDPGHLAASAASWCELLKVSVPSWRERKSRLEGNRFGTPTLWGRVALDRQAKLRKSIAGHADPGKLIAQSDGLHFSFERFLPDCLPTIRSPQTVGRGNRAGSSKIEHAKSQPFCYSCRCSRQGDRLLQ